MADGYIASIAFYLYDFIILTFVVVGILFNFLFCFARQQNAFVVCAVVALNSCIALLPVRYGSTLEWRKWNFRNSIARRPRQYTLSPCIWCANRRMRGGSDDSRQIFIQLNSFSTVHSINILQHDSIRHIQMFVFQQMTCERESRSQMANDLITAKNNYDWIQARQTRCQLTAVLDAFLPVSITNHPYNYYIIVPSNTHNLMSSSFVLGFFSHIEFNRMNLCRSLISHRNSYLIFIKSYM